MLRKRDELQFPKLFNHIRLRREQGILIFISCRTPDVEAFLVDKLKAELSGLFTIEEVPIDAGGYAPVSVINAAPGFSSETLYIVGGFPFDVFYKDPEAMDRDLECLTTGLNLGRGFFFPRNLKCVFFVPPEVENRIALKAPDFYHFTHYSASFTDDAKFHRDIKKLERGGQDKRKRIEF